MTTASEPNATTDRTPTGADGGTDRVRAVVCHPVWRQRPPPSVHSSPATNGPRSDDGHERLPEDCLEEVVGLARAIDLDVREARLAPIKKARSATLFGQGTVSAIGEAIAEHHAELCIVDATLTPAQQRNLERAWDCKVLDRTGLILEIFGARAVTHEGRLQVELAHLSYQKSRLVRAWTHLERQRGGGGFLGGPGETQVEADRRQIDERILSLKRDLEGVRRTRRLHRKARQRAAYPVVALVGYTNAGKSSLFNRLTGSDVFVRDLLFATLDTTMRSVDLPSGRKVILSDTVGFVSDLPTDLVAAFRATLEEVREAELIIHVRDIACHDTDAQRHDVLKVLDGMGIKEDGSDRIIEVLNKSDLLADDEAEKIRNLAARRADMAVVSALTGAGVEAFLALLDERLGAGRRTVKLAVSHADGAAISWLYEHGEVESRVDDGDYAHLTVRLEADDIARFERQYAAVPDSCLPG